MSQHEKWNGSVVCSKLDKVPQYNRTLAPIFSFICIKLLVIRDYYRLLKGMYVFVEDFFLTCDFRLRAKSTLEI